MSDPTHTEDFIYDVRVVRRTRFAFSKRMEVKARVKSFVVNITTVAGIFISVYLLANSTGIEELELKRISVALIGLSLLALWMSLDTPPSDLARRGGDAHQCGLEIGEVYRGLKYGYVDLNVSIKKYEEILSRYERNHDALDRRLALYEDRHRHPKKAEGVSKWNSVYMYHLSCYSSIALAILWSTLVVVFQVIFPI